MLLDKQSRSVTIPSLEIDQPDCRRAAHASSVGPIDPAQLFYLESRGITPDEARKFITLGFLEPVVARVPLESEQEHLWGLLEAKWADSLADTGADGNRAAASAGTGSAEASTFPIAAPGASPGAAFAEAARAGTAPAASPGAAFVEAGPAGTAPAA
jgi:hypothetical protein